MNRLIYWGFFWQNPKNKQIKLNTEAMLCFLSTGSFAQGSLLIKILRTEYYTVIKILLFIKIKCLKQHSSSFAERDSPKITFSQNSVSS